MTREAIHHRLPSRHSKRSDGRMGPGPGALGTRLWRESQVGLQRSKALRELRFCVLVRYRRRDDYLGTRLPVDRCGDAVFDRQLKRIEGPQNLVNVPAYRGGVGK